MNDIAAQAVKKGAAHSKFLTASEAASVRQMYKNRRDVTVSFEGGFNGAERAVAVFVNSEWGDYRREDIIAALAITCRKQDSLSHPDIYVAQHRALNAQTQRGAEDIAVSEAVLFAMFNGKRGYDILALVLAPFRIDKDSDRALRAGKTAFE
jgi:RNA-binding protein YlmH